MDDSSEDDLSDICRYFLAGQLAHAPAICAFAAPTVNCAKRFKLYSFAPTNATWGIENRTTGLRVKATRNESTHVENRFGCGASNPYLLMATCLAAGIDGLKKTNGATTVCDWRCLRGEMVLSTCQPDWRMHWMP